MNYCFPPRSSSQASLWSSKDTGKKCADQDTVYCTCDKLCTPADKTNKCDTSSMSFSGPYILCQVRYSPFVSNPGTLYKSPKKRKRKLAGNLSNLIFHFPLKCQSVVQNPPKNTTHVFPLESCYIKYYNKQS